MCNFDIFKDSLINYYAFYVIKRKRASRECEALAIKNTMRGLLSPLHDGHLSGLNPDAMQRRYIYNIASYMYRVKLFKPIAHGELYSGPQK